MTGRIGSAGLCSRVPRSNVAPFATLAPALSEAEGVGFQCRLTLGIFPELEQIRTLAISGVPYSACFVIFKSTPTHISVINDSDDPP